MSNNKEVCWFLTLRCNQECKYCHRFQGISESDIEKNKAILETILEDGIKKITFTGGEALLYPNLIELLRMASNKGIKCKLISNGSLLACSDDMNEALEYLDSLTLSIDSIDSNINERMGRGKNHYSDIKAVLDKLKDRKLKVNINTVVSKVNLGEIEKLGHFLENYNIETWRIFKFMPLRETAKVNEKMFEVSKADFMMTKNVFASFSKNIKRIEYREEPDMESKYILIMPNGDVVVTENSEDVTIGNMIDSRTPIFNIIDNNISENDVERMVDISQLNEYDRYIEHLPLNDLQITLRAYKQVEEVDKLIENKEGLKNVIKEIWKLPSPQNRRVYMYYIDEFTTREIAKIEGCNQSAVVRSINTGIIKLRKNLKNF